MIDYIFVVVLLLLLFAFLSPFSSEANTAFLSLSLSLSLSPCVCVCACLLLKQSNLLLSTTKLYYIVLNVFFLFLGLRILALVHIARPKRQVISQQLHNERGILITLLS